ncbi:hypothetical protein K432DRAFT_297425 [Lepidopterella palustris CBS 459.81]|uniref:AB hydrolase-1 domain-containing protein n=1 Tax=Lepidopterella palustris CBS 459.81 TaxID=1314670 RepID=A0A8E2JFC0_9PEZI|nr:hypothetical protein K432DRAFT_297425 [Lepidopterella palustris CBS 459.81]
MFLLASSIIFTDNSSLIAISGLGGHAFGSFKEKDGSYMWLRDSLPQDLKRTRILLYGYDSTLANSASVQTIADLANDLQKAIGFIRNYDEADPERPLVLLGHSLGGIIAKQALITMKDGFKSDQANLKATHAILFFGVPNHGMEIASLIAMVGDGPNRYLLETLSRTSETLRKQEKDFPEVFYFKDSIIFSYYETKESPIVELINGKWKRSDTKRALLVDRNSATQARPWESKERYIQPIARDHSEMVKFPPNDDDYKKVLRHLKEITKNASAVIQDRFESSSTGMF